MRRSACILLSTYNGEEYLSQQLDSILQQDIENCTIDIIIRDDGSTDRSLSIIHEYVSKYPQISFIKSDERMGPGRSFLYLLEVAPDHYDYYAFSDQDDIWKEKKLQTAINKIDGKEGAALYCSNQMIYINGKECGLRFEHTPNYSLTSIICMNKISGNTMVMNKELRKTITSLEPSEEIIRFRLHDTWTLLVALVCGSVFYDDNSYVLYRIHDYNTVGIRKRTICNRVLKGISKIKNKNERNIRSAVAKELLNISTINERETREVLELFAKSNKGIMSKINLLKSSVIKRDCPVVRAKFVLETLVGWQ